MRSFFGGGSGDDEPVNPSSSQPTETQYQEVGHISLLYIFPRTHARVCVMKAHYKPPCDEPKTLEEEVYVLV